MPSPRNAVPHPRDALFAGERAIPVIPACEHFAGSEKLIGKALELQGKLGPIFDVTCDCEDGAEAGKEKQHAEMVVDMLTSTANLQSMAGVRIHDYTHPHWKKDVDIVVGGAGKVLSHVTVPKVTAASQAAEMIGYIEETARRKKLKRDIPVHVLIETHGALHEAWQIAGLDHVQVLDFGLMDFVSAHHGAIPVAAMVAPGQFEHPLVVRAKCEIAAAALAHDIVPAHNVTRALDDPDRAFDDARRARDEFGYLRMWSIHPSQIDAIVDAMRPAVPEVEKAQAIVHAAQDAQWGPLRIDGELHDRASYRAAWSTLQRARAAGIPLDPRSAAYFATS